jgi:hypothetical protein
VEGVDECGDGYVQVLVRDVGAAEAEGDDDLAEGGAGAVADVVRG